MIYSFGFWFLNLPVNQQARAPQRRKPQVRTGCLNLAASLTAVYSLHVLLAIYLLFGFWFVRKRVSFATFRLLRALYHFNIVTLYRRYALEVPKDAVLWPVCYSGLPLNYCEGKTFASVLGGLNIAVANRSC